VEPKIKLKKLEASLSNERTMLSYTRTAMSVLVLAVAMLKFFTDDTMIILGWAAVVFGVAILGLGIVRYIQERKRIHATQL
jgi:putative membrane protein